MDVVIHVEQVTLDRILGVELYKLVSDPADYLGVTVLRRLLKVIDRLPDGQLGVEECLLVQVLLRCGGDDLRGSLGVQLLKNTVDGTVPRTT